MPGHNEASSGDNTARMNLLMFLGLLDPPDYIEKDDELELEELAGKIDLLILESGGDLWRNKVRSWAEGKAEAHHRWRQWHESQQDDDGSAGGDGGPPKATVEVPDGDMGEEEKYARLAAVCDSTVRGVGTLGPWGPVDVSSSPDDAAVCYEALVQRTPGLYVRNKPTYRSIFNKIQKAASPADSRLMQQPWDDDATEYIGLTEAVGLIDKRKSVSALSKHCKLDGEMRYMREPGKGCKVHVGDLLEFMKARHADPEWAKAYLDFRTASGKGDHRFFWRCTQCGHEYAENANAPACCPKCQGDAEITRHSAPEPPK